MIWKTFLISFILNSGKHKNLILKDSIYTSPTRSRSYSEDLDDNNNSSFIKNPNSFFSKSGYDNRYNGTQGNDVILNITRFNMQMELLKTLENKHVSQDVKLDFIEQYNKNKNASHMMPDIFSGGLYKDWEFD